MTPAYCDVYCTLSIGSLIISSPIITSIPQFFLLPRQAVKKSKQFEIQKIVRRLKQASSDAPTKDATNISKLESVLVSLRAADIDRLANLAAASVGYCLDGITTPAAVVVDNIELLDRKILSANCVSEQLDVMVKALKAIKAKAERQQQRNEGEQADVDEKKKEKALVGSGDSDEESLESSEEENEIEPDEDALQAIEKILALKQIGGHRGGSTGDEGQEEVREEQERKVSSEDDSGVIENLSEQEEDLLLDTDFIANTEDEEEERDGVYKKKSGGGSDSNKKVKSKAKPKKPKNRLGQRARRQLAGQQQPLKGGTKPAPYRQGQVDGGRSIPYRDDGRGAGRGFREIREDTSRKTSAKAAAEDEGPLHPSWAARRQEKQKLSIVNAAGVPLSNKKIVFDNDGSEKVIAPKPSLNSSRPPRPANAVPANYYHKKGSQEESEGPLHPSWELKKELANAQKHIQPPQGKKIVFDD